MASATWLALLVTERQVWLACEWKHGKMPGGEARREKALLSGLAGQKETGHWAPQVDQGLTQNKVTAHYRWSGTCFINE